MVNFLWPLALLLLPLPWFWLRRPAPSHSSDSAIRVPPLLAEAMTELETDRRQRPSQQPILLWLVWTCLVIAIAQPQWTLGDSITSASGRSLILVIDLSGSMERDDFSLNGENKDRLTVVKTVARHFIEERKGDRLGLVLFGDEAFVASPMSFDLKATSHALEESAIGMAGRTTALGNALGLALVKLNEDPATDKAVILLTDGSNNAGNADPLAAADLAAQWKIRVHTIGMGSHNNPGDLAGRDPSAELDTTALKAIAQRAGGQYFRADSTESLTAIYSTIDDMENSEHLSPPLIPRHDIRHYFLLTALLLTLIHLGNRLWNWRPAL